MAGGFFTNKEDARKVAKVLSKEVVPRWGCPLMIDSDKGPALTSKVTQTVSKLKAIEWKYHIPYHPQSLGIVERMIRTVNAKLRKATGGTFVKWETYLPVVLAEIRITPNKTSKLSPCTVDYGSDNNYAW